MKIVCLFLEARFHTVKNMLRYIYVRAVRGQVKQEDAAIREQLTYFLDSVDVSIVQNNSTLRGNGVTEDLFCAEEEKFIILYMP